MGKWVRHHDESTGKYYYHNTQTHSTRWEKPADYDGEDDSDSDFDPESEMAELEGAEYGEEVVEMQENPMRSAVGLTAASGTLDYSSEEPTSSSSEEEEEEDEHLAALPAAASKPVFTERQESGSATKKHIGGSWYENIDRVTGRTYYANISTRARQWTWPEDVPKPDYLEPTQPENEKNVAGTEESKSNRLESTQQNFSSPSEYLASLEARLKAIESQKSSYDNRIEHLESQEGEESKSLASRRSMLFFGVKTLDPEDPVIVHTRAWQNMTEEERIADAARHGIWPVIKAKFHGYLYGGASADKSRVTRADAWIHELKDEDRLDWNTDLAAIETFKKDKDQQEEADDQKEDDDDEEDLDLMFEMSRDDDPHDPAKFEASESLHLLTFYTCHQVFVDKKPLPQQWSRANYFLGFSFFVALMQNFVIYRLICLVANENKTFYGVPGFPNKLNLWMGNDIAVPIMRARQYVDYGPNFDPTRLNPNGCTMNDYKELDYCDTVCDDKPCACDHMCVEKLLTWGEFGARAGGKGAKIRDDDEYSLKHFHEYATLKYTTDSNWCHENKNRVFNTSKVRYLGVDRSKRPDNVGYVGEVDDENTYKSFSVNDTIIKRCISCADILADVRICVAKKNDPLNPVSGTPSVCNSHSQAVISDCAGKMCPSSMNVEDTEVLIGVVDFPALVFMYVVIGLMLVSELREMFICDTAFKRSVKNAKRLKVFSKRKQSLAKSLRVLQQLRRFFILPGIVILMCIANFSSESVRDVIGSSIEMGFLLDVDNLFFNMFFSTSGEKELVIDLLKVRLSPTQEKKLNGACNLNIAASVTQMTFFSLIVFRGKRCLDNKTLDALMKSVFLAQAFAILPLAYSVADMNIARIQRYKKRLNNGGKEGAPQNIFAIWKALFVYGLDKFIVLCVPASTWISGFTQKYYDLGSSMGATAPTTYIFSRMMILLTMNFIPFHIVTTSILTAYIACKKFGDWFYSLKVGDIMYDSFGGLEMALVDWALSSTAPILMLYPTFSMMPGPWPSFIWGNENGDYLKEDY